MGNSCRFARYARKLVVGPFILKFSCKYRAHSQLSVAAVRERGEIGLSRAQEAHSVYVRVPEFIYICSPWRNGIAIFKGYPPTERGCRIILARDNRDERSVTRRSMERGHSYELPERAVSKIDFQLRGFVIRSTVRSLARFSSPDPRDAEIRRRWRARR